MAVFWGAYFSGKCSYFSVAFFLMGNICFSIWRLKRVKYTPHAHRHMVPICVYVLYTARGRNGFFRTVKPYCTVHDATHQNRAWPAFNFIAPPFPCPLRWSGGNGGRRPGLRLRRFMLRKSKSGISFEHKSELKLVCAMTERRKARNARSSLVKHARAYVAPVA